MKNCPCGFTCARLDPRTAAYHRAHRATHIEVFPDSTAETLANLNTLVEMYERKEVRT